MSRVLEVFGIAACKADPGLGIGKRSAIEEAALRGHEFNDFMLEMFQWGCEHHDDDDEYVVNTLKSLMESKQIDDVLVSCIHVNS